MKKWKLILGVACLLAGVATAQCQSWITNGLVAYYPFNGNANDASGNGIGMTMTNSGASFVADRFGNTQTALDLQNGAFLQSTKNLPYFGNSDRTYSAWIYVVTPAAWPDGWFIGALGSESSSLGVVTLYLKPAGYFSSAYPVDTLAMDASYGDTEAAIGLSPSTGKWIHIVWEYRGNLGASQFYANGQAVSTHVGRYGDASTTLNSAAGPLRFGYQFNGYLDDVRIYNRALSSDEVAQLYALEAPVPPVITNSPQSVAAVAGSSTNLSVTATGSQLLTYQWLKDGVALPGATNATLVFSNLQPVNVGDYVAVVSNGGGSATSGVASVSIPGVNSGVWQGLVAYYPFNGNANDESGFGNDGQIFNAAPIADRFGKTSSAFLFNGAARIETANAPQITFSQNVNVSAFCWVRFAVNQNNYAGLIAKMYKTGEAVERGMQLTLVGNKLSFQKRVPPFWIQEYSGNRILNDDKWHLVGFVLDQNANTLKLFVDGAVEGAFTSSDFAGDYSSPASLLIGVDRELGWYFVGAIDDIRIYKRALSSNEVAQLYLSEAPPTPPRTATATATLSFGFFVNATVTDGGFGYTNTPLVRIVGGGGSGAQAVAVVSNGLVVGINVINPGSGYTSAPMVVIQPPVIAQPELGISAHTLLSFTNLAVSGNYQLQRSKEWYWTNEAASFTATGLFYTQMVAGAPGSKTYRLALSPAPAQAFATPVVAYGFLVAANVTAGGSGYVSKPNVHIAGGGGSNAVAVANMSGGSVSSISMLNAGYGYTNTPTLQIDPPPAASINPSAIPVMRVDSGALSPYDNYQVEFKPVLGGAWQNWGGNFVPTAATNSQWLYITNGMGFFRVKYLP